MRQAVLLLLIVSALAVAQRPPVEAAWDLVAKGDRAKAVELLQNIIRTNPRDADARLLLGSLLAENGNRAEALAQLQEAVKLRPNSAEAHQAFGEALNKFGDTKPARAEFEKAVAVNPNFAQARIDLGAALLQAGESKSAAEHLDRAIRLLGKNADSAYPRYLRAKIYTDLGDVEHAAALLKEAVAIRPDFAEAWSDLGQACKSLHDDTQAFAAFQRSVEVDPENSVAQYRLGAEYLRQDNTALAVKHLEAAFQLNPTDQSTLNSLQIAYRQNGQPEEARRIKEKLVEVLRGIDKESQGAFTALQLNNEGAALEKAGNLPAALEKYRQAVALDPAHIGIRINFAVASLRLGHWAEGIAELREALRRDPENKLVKATLDDALRQAPPGSIR